MTNLNRSILLCHRLVLAVLLSFISICHKVIRHSKLTTYYFISLSKKYFGVGGRGDSYGFHLNPQLSSHFLINYLQYLFENKKTYYSNRFFSRLRTHQNVINNHNNKLIEPTLYVEFKMSCYILNYDHVHVFDFDKFFFVYSDVLKYIKR